MQTWFKKLLDLLVTKHRKVNLVTNLGSNWQLSKTGMAFLIHEEGFKYKLYRDIKGLPTIGVGHLITSAELSSGFITLKNGNKINIHSELTRKQVENILHDDLSRFYKSVNKLTQYINQGQFDALVSFAFNIGVSGFEKSTAVRLIKESKHEKVPQAMLMWNKPKQLIGRRTREANKYKANSL